MARAGVALTLGVAVSLSAVACGTSADEPEAASPQSVVESSGAPPRAIPVEGEDRLPSTTASDWVTYADYVAVVHVTAQHVGEPPKDDLDGGSVLRKLTLTVDRVLWSSPTTSAEPPQGDFSHLAFDYAYSGDDPGRRTRMVADDEPRLEVGHSYIMALDRQADRCTPGDYEPPPATRTTDHEPAA